MSHEPHNAPDASGPSPDDLRELDQYLDAEQWETAREVLDLLIEMFPDHPDLLPRLARIEAGGEVAEDQSIDPDILSFLDDFATSDDSEEEPPLPEELPVRTIPEESAHTESPTVTTWEESVEEIPEEEPEEDEQFDFETHYQRAIVYRDMDIHGKAVNEITKAFNAEPPDEVNLSYFQAYYLLGQSHGRLGNHAEAIAAFRRCLNIPERSEDEYQAVRYDLGLEFEAAGDRENAIEAFTEILTTDINYRDVRDRIKNLN